MPGEGVLQASCGCAIKVKRELKCLTINLILGFEEAPSASRVEREEEENRR
jgi:hypothetical protein